MAVDHELVRVLIFEAGDYPVKRFAMTPLELRDMAEHFKGPLDVTLDFINTPLDGQLGQLVSVEVSDDGTKLYGNIRIPHWLAKLGSEPGRNKHYEYAPGFDRHSKALISIALTEKNAGVRGDDAVR